MFHMTNLDYFGFYENQKALKLKPQSNKGFRVGQDSRFRQKSRAVFNLIIWSLSLEPQ